MKGRRIPRRPFPFLAFKRRHGAGGAGREVQGPGESDRHGVGPGGGAGRFLDPVAEADRVASADHGVGSKDEGPRAGLPHPHLGE